ncbi:MAG: T9SS type A sorting domain-containing protein [Bacteroidia bacterium]
MRHVFIVFILLAAVCTKAQIVEIYVSDAGNFNNPPWQILKFDENGQNPTVFIDTNVDWPQDILFVEDSNRVLISNLNSNLINWHDATTGDYIGLFANGINGPTRMSIGPDSLLYVLQWGGTGRVLRYQLDGTLVGDFTSVSVSKSIGMAWDALDNLYVSSYDGDIVRQFDSQGNDLGLFVTNNLDGPTNIWFDDKGDLLVVDYDGNAVKRFDAAGFFKGTFITGLGNAEGVAFMANGDILLGNGATKSVKRYDDSGSYLNEFIASGAGNLLTPNAVVIRERSSNSIGKSIAKSATILVPNIGTEFNLSLNPSQRIDKIEVFNLAGKSIDTISSTNWNAHRYPEGLYLVVADLADGTKLTQKIIVQR